MQEWITQIEQLVLFILQSEKDIIIMVMSLHYDIMLNSASSILPH